MDQAQPTFLGKAVAGLRWSSSAPNALSLSGPKPLDCATMSPRASRAITFRRAGRFPSRSSAPKAPNKMSARAGTGASSNYLLRVFALAWLPLMQLARRPSHSHRAEAARRSTRYLLLLTTFGGAIVIVLMYALDIEEIVLMP